MHSRSRVHRTTQNSRGGRNNRKPDPPQNIEKISSSRSTRVDEQNVEKTDLLNSKVNRPKKEIPEPKRETNQSGREKYVEPEKSGPRPKFLSRAEIKKEKDNKSEKLTKKVSRDKIDEGNDSSDRENEENEKENKEKENKDEINEIKEKLDTLMVDFEDLLDQNRILNKRIDELEEEVYVLKNNEFEFLVESETHTAEKVKYLEMDLDITKDGIDTLKRQISMQFDDLKPAEQAEDNWKIVDEKLMAEMKHIMNKLEKRLKKKDMDEIVIDLKKEISELKEKMKTATTPIKHQHHHDNDYGQGEQERSHTGPGNRSGWWRPRKKRWKPLERVWCSVHRWCGHLDKECWDKKKIWRVKKIEEGPQQVLVVNTGEQQ